MGFSRQAVQAAYEEACRREIEALKPGNVHVFAGGHDMSVEQFLDSARVSSGPLTDPGLRLGARMLEAVRATRKAVGINTNLGIVLLCGPLIAAVEREGDLRANLAATLGSLDMEDARNVFAAIAQAAPGGLGEAEDDVRRPPKTSLLDAMRQAADRDMIARQYVSGFADLFDVGSVVLDAATARGETGMWPVVFTYLAFLSRFPDSHVTRKWGSETAGQVRDEAAAVADGLLEMGEQARLQSLVDFDRRLKDQALNPGTSADLTVATLLAGSLSPIRA